jgi:hypothetical protein
VLTSLPKPAHSPPLNRHKPLPSPPVAQYVNPLSPPKAHRTLVDAEVAGTPTSQEWPILSPENASAKKSSPLSTTSLVYPENGSTPEPTQPAKPANGGFSSNIVDRSATGPLETPHESTLSPVPASSTKCASLAEFPQGHVRDSKSSASSPTIVHAITTTRDEALDSPLARKLAVPPRISSKRTSLPLASTRHSPAVVTPHRRQTKPGSTKWPSLAVRENKENLSTSASLVLKHEKAPNTDDDKYGSIRSKAETVPEVQNATFKQRISSHSTAIRTMAGARPSSSETEPAQVIESGSRTKRLSAQPTSSGLGPILKIANDADSVLLGQGDFILDASSVLDTDSGKASQERSLSALAGRISRQTMTRMSLSMGSGSSTPQLAGDEVDEKSIIKITPIRSMQAPRKAVVESQLRSAIGHSKPLVSVPGGKRHSSAGLQTIAPWESALAECGSCHTGNSPILHRKNNRVSIETQLEDEQQLLTTQQSDENLDASPSKLKASANPWNSPKTDLSKTKKTNTNRNNTSRSLIRLAHRDSCTTATKNNSATSRPYPTSRGTHHRDGNSPGSNRSGSYNGAAVGKVIAAQEPCETAMSLEKKTPVHSMSSLKSKDRKDFHHENNVKLNLNEAAAKVKGKRSFRDFFHIRDRDGKRAEKDHKQAENKRSSLTITGNTLAKHFRHSANVSRPKLTLTSESKVQPPPKLEADRATPYAHDMVGHEEKALSDSTPEAPAGTCSETAVIVTNIVNQVSSLPDSSPDRLRGLEIAEVCKTIHTRSFMLQELVLTVKIKQGLLNSVDAYKQARISATKAKRHAREAEINAERAGIELERLQKLCEPDFDHETVQAIKELVMCVGSIGREEQSSHAAAPTQ